MTQQGGNPVAQQGGNDAAPSAATAPVTAGAVMPMRRAERAGAVTRRAGSAIAEAVRELWLHPDRLLYVMWHGKPESMAEHRAYMKSRAWVPPGMDGGAAKGRHGRGNRLPPDYRPAFESRRENGRRRCGPAAAAAVPRRPRPRPDRPPGPLPVGSRPRNSNREFVFESPKQAYVLLTKRLRCWQRFSTNGRKESRFWAVLGAPALTRN